MATGFLDTESDRGQIARIVSRPELGLPQVPRACARARERKWWAFGRRPGPAPGPIVTNIARGVGTLE